MSEQQGFSIPKAGDKISPSDYAKWSNWMAAPEKPNLPVDVFLLYPTAYFPAPGGSPLGTIEDEGMRVGARHFLNTSGSAFETAGNIFAPFYRQLDAFWLLTQGPAAMPAYTNGVPKTDVLAAFDYYLKHLNGGRPFIIAGHSQGACIAKEIIFDYLNPKNGAAAQAARRSLVAAYLIGYAVTKEELAANPHVPFASGPDDTGVIISYNTEAPGVTGPSTLLLPGAVSINPISWTLAETLASASDNLGSYTDPDQTHLPMGTPSAPRRLEHLADARVNQARGVVECSSVDAEQFSFPEPIRQIFPYGIFHAFDIGFYYYNLRQNAEHRGKVFLNKG